MGGSLSIRATARTAATAAWGTVRRAAGRTSKRMTMLKWTMESVMAAIAIVVTTGGGFYTTVYHGGVVTQQIVDLQSKAAQTEAHVSKHDDQLSTIQQQNSAMKQSLDDIKDTVHDIQSQVRKPNGNHK